MAEKKNNANLAKKVVIYGELVPFRVLKKYSGVLMLVMLLLLGYIANKYMCQLDMQTINQLKAELARVKTDYVNASESYYSRIRETEMKELVDSFGLGLKSPECPPYRLEER